MKNLWGLVFVVGIIAVLLFSMFSFQVRETEIVLVTRFGKPVRTIDEPGLKWKFPYPIHSLHRFDSRNQLYEGQMEETTTDGGEPIIVTSYVVWKVDDPLRFLEAVRDLKGAQDQLKGLLRNAQNSVIGQHYFSEFVNSNAGEIKIEEIEMQMQEELDMQAKRDFGIAIREVGIKQLGVSQKVTQNVFERMRAERDRIRQATEAQGQAEATRIRTEAEAKRTELLAVAQAQAKAIRGQGDAEAAQYYELLEADPALAMFLRDIEALKKILSEKATVVLGADTDPVRLLKEVPDLGSE